MGGFYAFRYKEIQVKHMTKNDEENATAVIIAIGAILGAIWLGSKKRCPYCQEENERLATNCKRCGGII